MLFCRQQPLSPTSLAGFTIAHELAPPPRPSACASDHGLESENFHVPTLQLRNSLRPSNRRPTTSAELTDNRQVLTVTTPRPLARESHQGGGSRSNQPRVPRNAYIIQSFIAGQGDNPNHIHCFSPASFYRRGSCRDPSTCGFGRGCHSRTLLLGRRTSRWTAQ